MGWAQDEYFKVSDASVDNGTLTVSFYRLYTDARDTMSDCLRPDWKAVDDFIILVTGWQVKVTTQKEDGYTTITSGRIKGGSFEVRTEDKRIANWIWYLAAKEKVDYSKLAMMNRAKKFS